MPVEHIQTARVDDCKPVKYLVQTGLGNGGKYLKDQCKTVLPLVKEKGSLLNIVGSLLN